MCFQFVGRVFCQIPYEQVNESRIHVEFKLGSATMAFLEAAASPALAETLPSLPRTIDPLIQHPAAPSASASASSDSVALPEPDPKRQKVLSTYDFQPKALSSVVYFVRCALVHA